jgi:hypothetical protein
MELKTVRPAQRMGAYVAASILAGIRTAESERIIAYSASII